MTQFLSQHWLKEPRYCQKFVSLLQLSSEDRLLEIGPGKGALTWRVASRVSHYWVIEKDEKLKPFLEPLRVKILWGDACQIPEDVEVFLLKHKITKIFGNLPFDSATRIYTRFLPYIKHLSLMVFAFQKEVAQRITALPGKRPYCALSVLTHLFAEATFVLTIPPKAFQPPPKVYTGVVRFIPKKGPPKSFERLKDFLHQGFAQPRKLLTNNIPEAKQFQDLKGLRPHQVPPQRWLTLFEALKQC